MEFELDYERLREDLMNYYGAAMMYYPMAVIDLGIVENASNDKLVEIAIQNGIDLSKYQEKGKKL